MHLPGCVALCEAHRCLRHLLQRHAAVDQANQCGTTPLIMASRKGHLDVVRCLLQNHAAVDLGNAHGATPLLNAAANGHVDIVQYLLEHRATVDQAKQDGGFCVCYGLLALLPERDRYPARGPRHPTPTCCGKETPA